MLVISPDFADASKRFSEEIQAAADERPFNLIADGIFVTRVDGGGYIAFYNGTTIAATADDGHGLEPDGLFHFSINNPLG